MQHHIIKSAAFFQSAFYATPGALKKQNFRRKSVRLAFHRSTQPTRGIS